MSSILFNRGMYKEFATRSRLLKHLYRESKVWVTADLPDNVIDFLFELNADAYAERYGHHAETVAEIEQARADDSFDADDYDFGKVTDWNALPQIWHLLRRICYQCAEFSDDHVAIHRLRKLEAMIDLCATMQMQKVTHAAEMNQINPLWYSFS